MSRSTVMDGLQELITKFRALTLDQQAVFLDLVDPLPDEPKAVKVKRTRKAGSKPRRGLGSSPLTPRVETVAEGGDQ